MKNKNSVFYDPLPHHLELKIFRQFRLPMQSTTCSIILHECVSTVLSQKRAYAETCVLYSRRVSLVLTNEKERETLVRQNHMSSSYCIVFTLPQYFHFGTFSLWLPSASFFPSLCFIIVLFLLFLLLMAFTFAKHSWLCPIYCTALTSKLKERAISVRSSGHKKSMNRLNRWTTATLTRKKNALRREYEQHNILHTFIVFTRSEWTQRAKGQFNETMVQGIGMHR